MQVGSEDGLQLGDSRVDDRVVEDGHEGAEDDGDEDQPLVRRGQLRRRARPVTAPRCRRTPRPRRG